jgi:hypothetical protein
VSLGAHPDIILDQRFPLVCVVPVTGTPGEGLFYRPLAPGLSGSSVNLHQKKMAAIDGGLAVFLGLGDRLRSADD